MENTEQRRASLRPRNFRWSIMFACNDYRNGGFQGYVENIHFGIGRGNFEFGTDYLDDHDLSLTGERLRFRWKRSAPNSPVAFSIGGKPFRCVNHREWVGNWCWDACMVERSSIRALARLLKANHWSPESGSEWLWKWWGRIEAA